MASLMELVQLFKKGELGKLLARAFNAERGHVLEHNEDLELIVVFSAGATIPSVEDIARVVKSHFSGLGYRVHRTASHPDGFEAFVNVSDDPSPPCMHMVITTDCKFDDDRRSLRVNTKDFIT
ncbi:MAG: hypothetical protein KBC33_03100 [Candidatus Pacebacteria bacterium]|nr:hypothetical protein [Candidatus Paceibacterota bacterium]